jgi:hypothetical protein
MNWNSSSSPDDQDKRNTCGLPRLQIDDAEHRRTGTDGKAERQERDQSDHWPLAQRPE